MGASARIMAYLGLDNSPFTRVLDETVVAGEHAVKGLERSFGAHHIFKGLLQGMGIGSIEGMVAAIQSPFKRGAEEADRAAETSERMGDVTFKALQGFGSLQQKLMATRAELKGMPVELDFARQAVEKLDSGFTGVAKWVNPETMELLTAAEGKVDGIKVKTAQLQLEEQRVTEEMALQTRELERQLEKIDRAVTMFGKPQLEQIGEHFKRSGELRREAQKPGLTDAERKSLTVEADQEFAAGRIGFKQLALQEVAHADRMRDLDRKAADIRATTGEKIVGLRREEEFYAKRAADESRTEAQRAEDTVKARELGIAADQLQVQRALERRAIEDQIRQIQEEAGAVGETVGEKILRMKRDAAFYDERSKDLDRTEKERDADHVHAVQLAASAAEAEYHWKNKSLTVDEAAKTLSGRHNTTALGVQARRIQSYGRQAEEARRTGRYALAEHFEGMARNETEDFQKTDRSKRAAAQSARLSAGEHASAAASKDGGGAAELKSAASELKGAAAELKNVKIEIELD